ncbi:hypothetical protein CVU37_07220 [candidate division BRC1 bacterium HGW-BRC1-1]|jgi:signal transduction histidine kinase|nr:MAG: hypothetical protein CVU37_07220 [candidate division BRC1 bacterium HGW-BRC1-1]
MEPLSSFPSQSPAGFSLHDIFAALAHSQNFNELLDVIVTTAAREMHADQGSLLLMEAGEQSSLKMLAAVGLPQQIVARGYVSRRGSISEHVMRERRPLIINGPARGGDYQMLADESAVRRRIHSALCVPLIWQGDVLGTLNLNRTTRKDFFTESDVETGFIVASQAAMVIANARLQTDLAQQQRLAAVGQAVAGISHCVKNILTGVGGGIAVTEIGLEKNQPELVLQGFGVLKRSAAMLQNLVLDMLDFSRERVPVSERFNLADVVAQVHDAVEHRASSRGVELRVTAEQAQLPAMGDRDQIFRALMNLVLNAIESFDQERAGTAPPPRVRLYAWRLHPNEAPEPARKRRPEVAVWHHVMVEDNGPGIPPDRQDDIWQMFHSTKGSRGTGIGLAVSRKMIEEHGGCIVLESEEGSGSIFRVYLPAEGEETQGGGKSKKTSNMET